MNARPPLSAADPETGAFTLTIRPDNIGVISIDVPGEKVNTLQAAFARQIMALLQQAQRHAALRGLILISDKPDSFIAGADIGMLDACRSALQAQELAQQGQAIFASIEALPFPVVAAIHGACLGGGLELALACDRRVCSSDDKTVLGLPEVQLGLLPGSGGTQRLPRLIGAPRALDLMLSGRRLRAGQALKWRLVDDVVPADILLDTAVGLVKQGKYRRPSLPWPLRLLHSAPVRPWFFRLARRQTRARTRGHYPAPEKMIQLVRYGLDNGDQAGYQAEAKVFGKLVMTPESAALRSLFFASAALKKQSEPAAGDAAPRRIGILGGGLMGGGIACVTALRAGLPVRIRDINEEGIDSALRHSWLALEKRRRSKGLRPAEQQRQMLLISGGTDFHGFRRVDLVIEAVYEDLALKRQMVAEVERNAAPATIFATNTSSLPIHQIAAGAQRPQQVIGLHYFSPVEKMPLVEVIPHAQTSAATIAGALALARQQGKTAIVVADRAGFYVNRILAPYVNEAARCLIEGEPIDAIDQALVGFGFPVGPLTLLDEVGIDIALKIAPILTQQLGERFSAPPALEALLADERKGRKNRRGFYLYPTRRGVWRRTRRADRSIYPLLGVAPKAHLGAALIAQRCVMLLLNEAARCLDEGVIQCARDGDIGAVFGLGFPPFTGGPFRYIDRLGVDKVVDTLLLLQQQFGDRFAPCARLLAQRDQRQPFYPAGAEAKRSPSP
ncbi:fatty acid oxidation complex subunit alpha FadJ [Affinibrenneria salicis]|uniref:enoyl-CoA hydratase n=1 Tax=Affinibrenneria salicis TaxID=2590031 RepID=A0A5J5FVW7_9GAMM|nr:fatty acid oxidation complex subunit alpha FadJ [Affinibrenneria salicis]KAA8996950.1 fatty acid oxidation complex subunit alpha FadJ [Affinibrenneria salicis]